MIIFTDDDTPFRCDNEVIMVGTLDTIPSGKDTTYILHTDKFTAEDVQYWSKVVQNRLVIVTRKAPKLNKATKDLCIVDDKLKGKSNDNTFLLVKALMNWTDRERVEKVWDEPPTELLNWFLRGNYTDIDFWRRISKVQYLLPQKYYKASVIHGLKPSRARVSWPKKKGKSKSDKPDIFRDSDMYTDILMKNNISVANTARNVGAVPKGMRKRKVAEQKWI